MGLVAVGRAFVGEMPSFEGFPFVCYLSASWGISRSVCYSYLSVCLCTE